jgi:hypothetical protein
MCSHQSDSYCNEFSSRACLASGLPSTPSLFRIFARASVWRHLTFREQYERKPEYSTSALSRELSRPLKHRRHISHFCGRGEYRTYLTFGYDHWLTGMVVRWLLRSLVRFRIRYGMIRLGSTGETDNWLEWLVRREWSLILHESGCVSEELCRCVTIRSGIVSKADTTALGTPVCPRACVQGR